MSSRASSKRLAGQFMGNTAAKRAKPNKLNAGPQVWARRDQLTSTKPIIGGMGMCILQKMGWKPGEGLGREKNGILQPILIKAKFDKRGLSAQEDRNRRKRGGNAQKKKMSQQSKEKHTVCPRNKLISTGKSMPPMKKLENEKGPSHGKRAFSSVQVNGKTFTPNKSCNTKKKNSTNSKAIKVMNNSQKEMSSSASSKHPPGHFTGSTGTNILKPNELNTSPQVRARIDQPPSTKPVIGEGLGREKNGSLHPLLTDAKQDKGVLEAPENCNLKEGPIKQCDGAQNTQMARQSVEEKHPVSLLNELTTKRKWMSPIYTLINENGPLHSKMFLFSVQVNSKTFTPKKSCGTKKEAKCIAAKHCLQQIGILPLC